MKKRLFWLPLALFVLVSCGFAGDRVATSPDPTSLAGAPLATEAPFVGATPTLVPTKPTASAPTAAAVPTVEPSPTAVPVVPTLASSLPAKDADRDPIALIEASPRRLRDQIELALALGPCRATLDACPRVARTSPLEVEVGQVEPFFVTDLRDNTHISLDAELRYAGPVLLMYVETGLPYVQEDLERAARAFEEEIYPRTREIFGSELQPGVDGDLRITILNARDPSDRVLGYYSSQDSLPRQINRFSNEREMFFMNLALMSFNDPNYLTVLAHEFQHMIHQHEQPGSATWFNEGASQLAEDLNGFVDTGFIPLYLSNPDTQLTAWRVSPGASGAHYGAAHLWMRYIYAQYAGEAQIRPLVQANAGNNLQAFVDLANETRPGYTSFGEMVADWSVANLIDDPTVGDGRYTYATGHELPDLLPSRAQITTIKSRFAMTLAQFGAAYLFVPPGSTSLTFEGATTIPLTAVAIPGQYAWWSGRSDDSVATLTREFDLRELTSATLRFATWYEIEHDYDYAFVTVSTDGGRTWETLPGQLTTTDDPQGLNYGHGITGISGQPGFRLEEGVRGRWVEETMDLTPYVGQTILLRFWQINDQGFNAPGMLIDNLQIPELGFFDQVDAGPSSWQAEGFVRVDGALPQLWQLRLVRKLSDGTYRVEALVVKDDGSVATSLNPEEEIVLVVVPTTPHTTEQASYQVIVE
ncbi:immune inhibitor A domain-containing protein [Candidatus Chloroploca sp. Khr17]|uniref:immune inhibitor A domain-containing protein n=1 Tax=Candidatus Chloroploca sp. Khr17 TaxID=2496869 RepID=UPI00101CC487|nr:immune inhibitor A domain-containing protein [Candidatus Chloroploca sp. Khr17]